MKPPTPEQAAAIAATGNVLIVASAGTGKTRTLVDRCLAQVLRERDPVSLDAMLMVTFTEAAATEMRQRLRAALQVEVDRRPDHPWLAEQLALTETAHICTLHSFCLQLVRDHFHELGLDPELTVLPEDQAHLLAGESLDQLFHHHYADDTADAIQQFVLEFDRGRDTALRTLILRVHEYTRTLVDPGAWLQQQEDLLARDHPDSWLAWLHEGFAAWRARWLPALDAQPSENTNARECAAALHQAGASPSRDVIAQTLHALRDIDTHWPAKAKGRLRKPIEDLFEDAAFLASLASVREGVDPLMQDWSWIQVSLRALLRLAREFGARFTAAKRELGAVDFQDLEQLALQLLWDRSRAEPTVLAGCWRDRFCLVLVDEYQDINAAQDLLVRALSREGTHANRFLVGDVKQSIYGFRLANPRIFQGYARAWARADQPGHILGLTRNFRSAPGILDFVNRLFTLVMRPEVGGLAYPPEQWLQAVPTASKAPPALPVEIHLLLDDPVEVADGTEDLTSADREARFVAHRLQRLRADCTLVRDRQSGELRPARWDDMAILLRAPRRSAETFARAFARVGIPLHLERRGFYDSLEVSDLLSLLQLLDNPLQDLPLLAVLRSPLAGLTPDELACLRIHQPTGLLWSALVRFHLRGSRSIRPAGVAESEDALQTAGASAWTKVERFLEAFQRWRSLARVAPLSTCLESILDDSLYEVFLGARPGAEQGLANVRRLLALTRQFDQFQRQGLHRFLRYVEARREADLDLEPGATAAPDAVRLLSVHQSKGLEFPVVVVAALGHRFNLGDLHDRVLLDEQYGLCPLIQPPGTRRRYPSLPHWLARQRRHAETLGEELRLLYVALTRARDRLILTGTTSAAAVRERWATIVPQPDGFAAPQLLGARCWLDWIGPWLCHITGQADLTGGGQHPLFEWRTLSPQSSASEAPPPVSRPILGDAVAARPPGPPAAAAELAELRSRLAWQYPHLGATRQAAKASVSQLRGRALDEAADEAHPWFGTAPASASAPSRSPDPAAIGAAHHRVLEHIPLDLPITRQTFLNTVTLLQQNGTLTPDEAAALDLEALIAFWESDFGRRIQAHHPNVHRELPFTARLSPGDLTRLGLHGLETLAPEEYVVVQGVADLAVVQPTEIWLLDFKTDRVAPSSIRDKVVAYTPQLNLYALALSRIYRRPVTDCSLHFLALRRTIRLPAPDLPPQFLR